MGLKSKEVMELEAKVVVGTYERAPVVLSSGKGCKLYDPEGREYLHCTSGIAVNALGHGDPDWVQAVTEQAHLLTHVSNVYYSVPQVELAKRPVECSFADHIFFSNSGMEANEAAIKFVQTDKANPLVKVLSAAVLLKYGLGKEKAVKGIENAVLDTLDRGFQTGNIYSVGNKVLGCKEIGEEVLKSVKVQNSHCCLN